LAETGGNLVAAEFPQTVRHEGRGAVHLIEQFWMLMDIAAPGLDIGLQIGDAVDDGHGDDRFSGFERFCFCSMQGAVHPHTLPQCSIHPEAYQSRYGRACPAIHV